MQTLKEIVQLMIALVCLAGAAVFCIGLAIQYVLVTSWELLNEYLREAFNTELSDFFGKK